MKGGRIADPVHSYVDFTSIEKEILRQPIAQRLRYISQNGLAHLVYPELRSSRFGHSLGAMDLASRFMAASFANSDDVRERLGRALRAALIEVAGQISSVPEAGQELLGTEHLISPRYCSYEHRPYVAIAEQGFRLAALFHDLGHLPYSHDFETALDEYWKELPPTEQARSTLRKLLQPRRSGEEKIHERLGHGLALLLFKEAFATLAGGSQIEAARISFGFAYRILEAGKPRPTGLADAVFRWLHSLMDGDLDVDRCDFILRDARNYGFEFATFDMERLLDNIAVVWQGNVFRLVVLEKGLSALESFLVARFRSYQYGVRHHKVAQVGAALRESIREILETRASDVAIATFLRDVATIGGVVADKPSGPSRTALASGNARRRLLQRFAEYDDVWWTTIMRDEFRKRRGDWQGVVCWRQPATSLWKRVGDLPEDVSADMAIWNESLPKPDFDLELQDWYKCRAGLRRKGVLLVRHDFSPWKKDPKGQSVLGIRREDGKIVPGSKVSSLIASLHEAWLNDVHVHAFARPSTTITTRQVLDSIPRFRRAP